MHIRWSERSYFVIFLLFFLWTLNIKLIVTGVEQNKIQLHVKTYFCIICSNWLRDVKILSLLSIINIIKYGYYIILMCYILIL